MSLSLEINRKFKASREKVFQAFTQPEIMQQWYGPGEIVCKKAEMEAREGGSYMIQMADPTGETYTVSGKVLECTPYDTFVYTWKWADPDAVETKVTVSFFETGDMTEVKLLHENFTTEESRDKHTGGWTGCLDKLEKFINK